MRSKRGGWDIGVWVVCSMISQQQPLFLKIKGHLSFLSWVQTLRLKLRLGSGSKNKQLGLSPATFHSSPRKTLTSLYVQKADHVLITSMVWLKCIPDQLYLLRPSLCQRRHGRCVSRVDEWGAAQPFNLEVFRGYSPACGAQNWMQTQISATSSMKTLSALFLSFHNPRGTWRGRLYPSISDHARFSCLHWSSEYTGGHALNEGESLYSQKTRTQNDFSHLDFIRVTVMHCRCLRWSSGERGRHRRHVLSNFWKKQKTNTKLSSQ